MSNDNINVEKNKYKNYKYNRLYYSVESFRSPPIKVRVMWLLES